MLISIGICAWNEAAAIERTLSSLLNQSLFGGTSERLPDACFELIVVPNGCTDQTAEIATRTLTERVAQLGSSTLSWSVRTIAEAGKSNAWNRFVHEFSDKSAELLVFLDADIEFREQEALFLTLKALLDSPQADVAVDLPLKDAWRKPRRTLIERISLLSSDPKGEPGLTGQFFCARSAAMRRIWMPKGLSVEDGFLSAMTVTDCMRRPADPQKIVRAAGASHYYETLTNLRAIFQHELRLVIGTTMNCYLIWDFLLFATDPNGAGAGEFIRLQLQHDPYWYAKLIANSVRNRGWWVLPRGMLFRRFAGRRAANPKGLALAFVAFVFDLPIFLIANRKLKRRGAIGYW